MRSRLSPRAAGIAALSAAVISTSALSLIPSTALAVPQGGYADLVEAVSPAVVFIEVTTKAQKMSGQLPDNLPPQLRKRFENMVPGNGAPR